MAQEEGAEAFPVSEEDVGGHEGDHYGCDHRAGCYSGGGVDQGGRGCEGDHREAEAEDLSAHRLQGADLDGEGHFPAFGRNLTPTRTTRFGLVVGCRWPLWGAFAVGGRPFAAGRPSALRRFSRPRRPRRRPLRRNS